MYLLLILDRFSGRKDVTSIFRSDIRLNVFLKKIRKSRVCVALKTIWNYYTLINIKFKLAQSISFQKNICSFQRALACLLLYVFCICLEAEPTT